MDTEPRMTRSRARALATPGAEIKTEVKAKPAATTGRRRNTRSAKDVDFEQDAAKQLFKDEVAPVKVSNGDAAVPDQTCDIKAADIVVAEIICEAPAVEAPEAPALVEEPAQLAPVIEFAHQGSAEEHVEPTQLVEEHATPAVPAEEPVAPTMSAEEPAAPFMPAEEPATPAAPVEEHATPAVPIEEHAEPAEEHAEWSSPDSTGGKSAGVETDVTDAPAMAVDEPCSEAMDIAEEAVEQSNVAEEMQHAMEEADNLDVSSVAEDEEAPNPDELSMDELADAAEPFSQEADDHIVQEEHEPFNIEAEAEEVLAAVEVVEMAPASLSVAVEEMACAIQTTMFEQPNFEAADMSTTPIAQAGAPSVAATPVRTDAAKTPKTANKTGNKPQRHVGFGSSSVKWSTPLPSAAPKTPGYLSVTYAGATPASKKIEKKVSIATPQHPKSAGPHHAIIRTPFPKSTEKAAQCEEEKDDTQGACNAVGVADVPSAAEVLPCVAASPEIADNNDDEMMDVEEISTEQPKPVRPASASNTDKYARGQAALQALANAEQAAVRPSSAVPSFMQPTAAARLKSKVVVPETYDPRSLNQLRREIKEAEARKAEKKAEAAKVYGLDQVRDPKAATTFEPRRIKPHLVRDDDEDEDMEAVYNEATEDALVEAINRVEIQKSDKPLPLKGLPLPQGHHMRFNDKGKVEERSGKIQLLGVPLAEGKHIRFD